ncbi:MAG: hypothetical protein AAGD43_20310 [Pseudomonadota bacterium]
MRFLIGLAAASIAASLSSVGANAGSPLDYWTGKGGHFFGGKCCYCVPAERHEVRGKDHIFWVDGKEKIVKQHQVRITPDPEGRKIYYCSGGLHLPKQVPHDRCGLIRGAS